MEIKTLDTLFHGTSKLEYLQSIIKNGFYPSYANENFGNQDIKIAMVSFSNIPLIEARNQVNYGSYFIGLSRDWGIKNKLQPVTYTYKESKFETAIHSILLEGAAGQLTSKFREFYKANGFVDFQKQPFFERLAKIDFKGLNENNAKIIDEIFGHFASQGLEMLHYLKHYIVSDKHGNTRYAYNDREWRYIINEKILFETDGSNKPNSDYKEWDKKDKPHFKDCPLSFELEDINFIITRSSDEIPTIFDMLNSKFTEDAVLNQVKSGNLLVLSLKKIWNNL